MRLEIYIPFEEPTFLANSVDFAGGNWHDRYLAVTSKAMLYIMPDQLGPLSAGENAYERNNQWMLEKAARCAQHQRNTKLQKALFYEHFLMLLTPSQAVCRGFDSHRPLQLDQALSFG
jgi:hypothetical protein